MIVVQDLWNRIESLLSAKGNYYNFTDNGIPAINSALEWTVSMISPIIGTNKFPDEFFREVQVVKVWQTSAFSRINIDPADTGSTIWTITGLWPKPDLFVAPGSNVFPSVGPDYWLQIQPFLGQQTQNSPIVSQAWNGVGNTQLEPWQSTFRPELAFRGGQYQAKRLNLEQWAEKGKNKFSAGYPVPIADLIQYGYLSFKNYNTKLGDYVLSVPAELEVAPAIPNEIVAIFYIEVPRSITSLTDTIPYPQAMLNIMVQKSLQFIGQSEFNASNTYGVSQKELYQLMGVI